MAEERNNSGTLGKNERKAQDNHPGYTGKCVIDGNPYWISAWIKDGTRGKFFSLAFKPREPLAPKEAPQVAPSPDPEQDPFDVPF
jgi:hypothetical protein